MKGILFNTVNVKAILDDRKFETRRPIKPQPTRPYYCGIGHRWDDGHGYEIKPICLVGDILYVQETWKVDSVSDHNKDMAIDFKALQSGYSQAEIVCKFTDDRYKKFRKFYQKNGWQSPYFLPKEAARIFLEVTDARVERLQDITVEGAIQEGVTIPHADGINKGKERVGFQILWNSTIKKQDLAKYSWQADPFIWVYEFKRINKSEVTDA